MFEEKNTAIIKQEQHKNIRPHIEEDKKSLIDLIAIALKRKWIVIGITGSAMIVAIAFSLISILLPTEKSFLPNVYSPKASMLIQSSNSSSISAALAASGLSSLADFAALSGNSSAQLAQVLATSNSILDSLNEKFKFSEKYKFKKAIISSTREAIRKKLTATIDSKSGLFTISFTDTNPILAKEAVDTVVELLAARFADLSGSKAQQQKDTLEKKLADVDSSVKVLEKKVKEFQEKYGVIQVDALATEQITILARLRSDLIAKEMEIENYKKISRIEDPTLTQYINERDGIIAKIKEIETGKGPGSKIMPSQRDLPAISFEFGKLQRDLLVQTELFKILTQQYELAKLNSSNQDPVFQVIEMAEVPDKKSGPSRSKICIVATIAAFAGSMLLVFILEYVESVKNDVEIMARFKKFSSKKEV